MNPQHPYHPSASLRGDNSGTHVATHSYYYQNYNSYNNNSNPTVINYSAANDNYGAPANQPVPTNFIPTNWRPSFQTHTSSNPYSLVHSSINDNNISNCHEAPSYNQAPFLTPPITTKQTNHTILPVCLPNGIPTTTTFNKSTDPRTSNFNESQPSVSHGNLHSKARPNADDEAKAFINRNWRPSFQTHTSSNPHSLVHSSINDNNISNCHEAPSYNQAPFLTPPITTKQTNHTILPVCLPDGIPTTTTFNKSTDPRTTNFNESQPSVSHGNLYSKARPNADDEAEAFINKNLKYVSQSAAGSTKSHVDSNAFIQQNSKYIGLKCETKSLDDKMLDFLSNNFVHLKKLPRSDSRSPENRSHRYSRSISKSPSPVRKTSFRSQDQSSSKSVGIYSSKLKSSPSPSRKLSKNVHHIHNDKNYKHKFTKSRSRSPSDSKSRFSRRLSRSQSPRSRSRSRSKSRFSRRCSRSRSPRSHQTFSTRSSQASQKSSKNNPPSRYTKSRSRSPSNSKTSLDRHPKSTERHGQVNAKFTEREELLLKYKKDYCPTISAFEEKINNMHDDSEDFLESKCWLRDTPAELYYLVPDPLQPNEKQSSKRLDALCDKFDNVLIKRAERCRSTLPKYDIPVRKKKVKLAKHKCEHSAHSSDESNNSSSSSSDEEDCTMQELQRKKSHPLRLHPELWFNDKGEMNDGPLCRCSAKARRSGIRHNIYAGENNLPKCSLNTNNVSKLHHYRITISPPTNFLIKTPTIIPHDNHEYIFEGFSMFSHKKLDKLPACKVIRFNIEYTILYFEEETPKNFTIKELDMFHEYLFQELLELVDLDFRGAGGDIDRCSQFHFMPRFVRELCENGKEILSMNEVLNYLLANSDDLVKEVDLDKIPLMKQSDWEKEVDKVKGMIVTKPAMKPCALRIDQLDRDPVEGKTSPYPEIVHFGIRPPQLSYAGNPEYQKAWREYVKFRHLLANMPKPSYADKRKLEVKENQLQQMRTWTKMKRDVTITVNSDGFKKTGIMCDIVQHAMLIPVLVSHLRFHRSLDVLEETVEYKFENRYLLQLALTHPSYRENFGTNPDHARNSLTNCGIRQPEYGDRRIHYMNTRKRGINTLINIMSRFGKKKETESNITHNERLEFLGDAVVEFITSIHLFHMFPQLEEGGLATYRAAVVQNQHLAELAKTLKLDEYMLYAHGSDLCHELELRHAMANCFEALMGALFLDGGIEVADKVFGETFFTDKSLLDVWVNYPSHPLQEQEPVNDRHWISKFEILQKLTKFEEMIGVEFTHIRLLARAFTDRSMGFTHLTLGSNQRLEFLGDTVLQLIASEYLYKYYPEHHEGHLSLLRSSLVNNRTQAVVCNDLGMTTYALYSNPKAELKTKDRADLLEAFLGALYIDKGMDHCKVFCNVCFFPRLQTSIMKQDWNDPKSKLQQCCLTLRTMEGGEPEIPVYKVIECMGPTNGRVFTVAVYFKGRRLAKATGNSIQQAEMNSAKKALQQSHNLFPQLDHQKRVIAKSLSQHPPRRRNQAKKKLSHPNRRPLRDRQ